MYKDKDGNEITKEAGLKKEIFIQEKLDEAVKKQVLDKAKVSIDDLIIRLQKGSNNKELFDIQAAVIKELEDLDPKQIKEIIESLE